MPKRRNKHSQNRPILLTFMGLFNLWLLTALLLQGTDVSLLNPKGFIAQEEHRLLVRSVLILLTIAVPTLTLFYFTAWKYRETNQRAVHSPDAPARKSIVFAIWVLPFLAMVLLASIMVPATHKLAPQKAIGSDVEPVHIQVVAMRWKWLFIYPKHNIATVNFVQIPVDTPIEFDLTADDMPMSSFWIPHLAGQLYTMTGHVNRLNIIAGEPGDFAGSSAEINGAGFAGMKFTARAGSQSAFDQWVQDTKQSGNVLDAIAYDELLVPSEYHKTTFYSQAEPDIYDTILTKYYGSHQQHTEYE